MVHPHPTSDFEDIGCRKHTEDQAKESLLKRAVDGPWGTRMDHKGQHKIHDKGTLT